MDKPLYCMHVTALSWLSGAAQRGMASSNAQDMAMTAWAFAKLEVSCILLFSVRFLLFAVCCSLFAVCCMLSSVCYLLSTVSRLPCLLSPPIPQVRDAALMLSVAKHAQLTSFNQLDVTSMLWAFAVMSSEEIKDESGSHVGRVVEQKDVPSAARELQDVTEGFLKKLVERAAELTPGMDGQQIVYALNAVAVAELPHAGRLVVRTPHTEDNKYKKTYPHTHTYVHTRTHIAHIHAYK
jgi:hypothetical protein